MQQATGYNTHVRRAFPNVWSSLFTVKIAADGTFESFSITTLPGQTTYLLCHYVIWQ